jgi:RNA polymerase primary sigma factor
MPKTARLTSRKASAAARVATKGAHVNRRVSGSAAKRPTMDADTERDVEAEPQPEEKSETASERVVAAPTQAMMEDQLASYFRHLSAHDLLSAEDERKLSLAIETAERATWSALLSVPELATIVLDLVEPHLEPNPEGPHVAIAKLRKQVALKTDSKVDSKVAKKIATVVDEAAVQLRTLDLDREHIDAALKEAARAHVSALAGGLPTWSKLSASKATGALQAANQFFAEAGRLRDDFVRANLRLVVTMARRYDRGQMALADLIQEGNLGLMHSVGRFDHRRGLRFSTYACWWIRHAIGRALADKARAVRIPVHMLEAQQQLEKVRRELTRELGRLPSPAELAKAARVPLSKLDQMHQYVMGQAISLDKPLHGDDERTFGDTMADPATENHSPADEMTSEALNGQVKSLLRFLTPIEADVLTKRFGIGDDEERTFREIGDEYALSRERIRQIQNGALDKLKRALEREHRGHIER